jgi:small basic protein
MLDELKAIKSGKKELREFGLTIGAILVILGGVALWRGRCFWPYLFTGGVLFAVLGLFLGGVLKPLQKVWMAAALVIGFFMSRLILAILFYAVITPMGLIAKVSGKDILDEKMDKGCSSYWKERDAGPKSKESYEKQF